MLKKNLLLFICYNSYIITMEEGVIAAQKRSLSSCYISTDGMESVSQFAENPVNESRRNKTEFSEKEQEHILFELIHHYEGCDGIPEFLDHAIKNKLISIHTKESITGMKTSILTYASYHAGQTGKTSIVDALLKNGARDQSAYVRTCNAIPKDPYAFRVLTSFIKHLGVIDPFTKTHQNYTQLMANLRNLKQTEVELSFLNLIEKTDISDPRDALRALVYKEFFDKQKLSSETQQQISKLIAEKHNNTDLGQFFLTVASKYGIDL